MKRWLFILFPWLQLQAQPNQNCILKDPTINITFGSGTVSEDYNDGALNNYRRVSTTCPTDGHYSYTPYTSDCFRGDWITLDQDHTGNHLGNMLLVNAAYEAESFSAPSFRAWTPGKNMNLPFGCSTFANPVTNAHFRFCQILPSNSKR